MGGRLVGGYLHCPAVRIHRPYSLVGRLDLHGNRDACGARVHVLERRTTRRGVAPARPLHDGEAVLDAPRRNGRGHPGACRRERVRQDERAAPASFLRAVHDKKIDLDSGENPFLQLQTSNPAEFRKHVENGRQVYYRNCVFCHGDNMSANGMFVHALDPIPTNFSDRGTIAMLRDTFLFWRISKGGPGLPEEGGPWDTAMPAWEKFLKEDEIWDVILFLYDFTEQKPRAKEEVAGK